MKTYTWYKFYYSDNWNQEINGNIPWVDVTNDISGKDYLDTLKEAKMSLFEYEKDEDSDYIEKIRIIKETRQIVSKIVV